MKYFCYANKDKYGNFLKDKDGNFEPILEGKDYQSIDPKLGVALDISDKKTLQQLTAGLADATQYHNNIGKLHAPGVTRTEFKTTLKSIQAALIKIRDKRGQHYKAVITLKNRLKELPELHIQYFNEILGKCFIVSCYSLTEEETEAAIPLLKIIDSAILNLPTGQAGKNSKAKQFIGGIACLAHHFKDALPTEKIKPYYDFEKEFTKFHKFVIYWLGSIGVTQKNAERHINHSIERYELK